MASDTIIRRATREDLPAVGALGAMLMRTHHGFDRERFIPAGGDAEEGYAWFLGTEMSRDDAAIFVAGRDGQIVGYVYVALEPMSWKELRDAAGFIHDIAVVEAQRGLGVARALIDAAVAWLRERGAPRVMLWTAQQNEPAQRLFAHAGFRRTMVEMTMELSE